MHTHSPTVQLLVDRELLIDAMCHGAGVADDIYAAGLLVAHLAFMPFCQPGSVDGPTIQVIPSRHWVGPVCWNTRALQLLLAEQPFLG